VTLEQLGNIGEFLAAIATIATLIYLAVQIRQNTQATRAASFHAVTDSMNHVNVAVAQDPALARVMSAGLKDRGGLRGEELQQFDNLMLSYFHVFETVHYQARVGAGERSLLEAEERSLESLLAQAGVREWWADNPYAFGSEFRAYIDRFLAEGR
jgi:hypothetical protein